MLQLTLIRHAATELNERGIYQGVRRDHELAAAGIEQARRLRTRLAARGPRPDAVWCSDLRRARRTAELAFPQRQPRCDSRLREMDLGGFEGLSFEENVARHGELFDRWLTDPLTVRPPEGGELLGELRERMGDWLETLPRRGRVAAVSHGGPIAAALEILTGMPFRDALRLGVRPTEAVQLWIEQSGATALAFLAPE